MRGALTRIALGLAFFAAALAAGFWFSQQLAPERLRLALEERLSQAVRSPVSIDRLRLGLGLGPQLIAEGFRMWPGPAGHHLEAGRVSATLEPLALLAGELRLRRIRFEQARLVVLRDADGQIFPAALDRRQRREEGQRPHPEEMLAPLIALENAARFLLAKPLLADVFEVRDSRIELRDALAPGPKASGPDGGTGGTAGQLALAGLRGEIRHRRLRGDGFLTARARLADAGVDRGSLEWNGRLAGDGAIRIAMAATDLDLEALAPYVRDLHPRARLDGLVSGVVEFATPSPGDARLEIDVLAKELASSAPPTPALPARFEATRAHAKVVLDIGREQVRLETARLASGDLDLRMAGTIQRPLRPESLAYLSLVFRDVELARVRDLVGWLPPAQRPAAQALVTPLERGRLVAFAARGSAPVRGWQDFFAGRAESLPAGLAVDLEVAELAVGVGESDRLEGVSGRISWTGDRVELREALGELNGSRLPLLDATLDGVSQLFSAGARRGRLRSGAENLLGLETLWRSLQPEGETEEAGELPGVNLEIEFLEHPAFLWPIRSASASIEPLEHGVRIRAERAIWAGVAARAEADWRFEPKERISVKLELGEPVPGAAAPPEPRGETWARGAFAVGRVDHPNWRQRAAEGRFSASGGSVEISHGFLALEPVGEVIAEGRLDLSHPDAVPFELSFALAEGDVAALAEVSGLAAEFATGRTDLEGSLQGVIRPEASFLADLTGHFSIRAREGVVRRALPPIVAVALASKNFNPFSSRDHIRYETVETTLDFEDGVMSTDSFALDGPDLRVFASGSVAVAEPPYELDAEVAIFLFRQLDRALERIPLVNLLLLGSDDSLASAYFRLTGPWDDPRPDHELHRSLAAGPGGSVLQALPRFLMRAIEALDAMLPSGPKGPSERAAKQPLAPPAKGS